MIGSWSLHFLPNDLFGSTYFATCCTGNCSRALYYAWESILDYEKARGELKVNLLLNRTSPWADINSYIPYRGAVEISVKAACEKAKVRMDSWIEKGRIACKVDGQVRPFGWDGNYLSLERLAPGQTVTIEFPIEERTVRLESFGHGYEATFRGNDCVELAARGNNPGASSRPYYLASDNTKCYFQDGESNYPLFQRGHYRDSRPRYIKVKRFACEGPIFW